MKTGRNAKVCLFSLARIELTKKEEGWTSTGCTTFLLATVARRAMARTRKRDGWMAWTASRCASPADHISGKEEEGVKRGPTTKSIWTTTKPRFGHCPVSSCDQTKCPDCGRHTEAS